MYHSIYIGDKNTWDDFHLVASSRPVVATPEVRTMYVDVHGTDGDLDLTTALTGDVQYKNREGSWEFVVVNWYESWEILHHKISNFLHGRKFKIVLEDDPAYYYMGRLSLNEWKSEKINSKITIDYHLDPFKYDMASSVEPWLWDPFSFETGVIREYDTLVVDGTLELTIPGSTRSCIPIITCSDAMSVTFHDHVYSLNAGDNRISWIIIGSDEEVLTFTGSGTVTVNYRGGWL